MFIVVGTNYRHCPLAVREKLFLGKKMFPETFSLLKEYGLLSAVILSTCNRMELYAEVDEPNEAVKIAAELPYTYYYQNEQAMRHLLTVATGIDSLVVGEAQIMEQIEMALALAKEHKMVSSALESCFKTALSAAKRIRKISKIENEAFSLSSLVKIWLKDKVGVLYGKKAVIIGMGRVTQLIVERLRGEGLAITFIANKARRKAHYLASSISARVAGFSEVTKELVDADIVLCATSSPHVVVTPEIVRERKKRLIALDLAVPRDIDPSINRLAYIESFHVEELEPFFRYFMREQLEKIPIVNKLITQEIEIQTTVNLRGSQWLEREVV